MIISHTQRLSRLRIFFQKSTNQQQELPVVGMFVNRSGRNEHSLQRAFHSCYLSSFGSFCQVVSEEKIFYESTNQQHELPVLAMFVNRSKMSNLYRGPSIDATYLPRFGSFGQTVSEEKMFQESTNQQQELPVPTMFAKGSGLHEQSLQLIFMENVMTPIPCNEGM